MLYAQSTPNAVLYAGRVLYAGCFIRGRVLYLVGCFIQGALSAVGCFIQGALYSYEWVCAKDVPFPLRFTKDVPKVKKVHP